MMEQVIPCPNFYFQLGINNFLLCFPLQTTDGDGGGDIGKRNSHGGGDGGDDNDYFSDFDEGDDGYEGSFFRRRIIF